MEYGSPMCLFSMMKNPYHWLHNFFILCASYIIYFKKRFLGNSKQYLFDILAQAYPRKPSWQLHFIHFQTKWFVNTSCSTSKNLNKSAFALIAKLQFISGVPVYVISPHSLRINKKVLYLHGGAFIKSITQSHIDMLFDLSNRIGCEFYVPLYTLADNESYPFQKNQVLQVYKAIEKQFDATNLVVMGDSAGGNLACGLIDQLINSNATTPSQLVLISPWLNLLFDHPKLKTYEAKDNILSRKWLACSIKKYIGNTYDADLTNPQLSPINLKNLGKFPPTLFFSGSSDMFYPDSLDFYERALEQKMKLYFISVNKGFHVFPAAPAWFVREANIARSQIASFISKPA